MTLPFIPYACIALLEGDPGEGKSLILADLAARVTRGGRMPDGTAGHFTGRGSNVLILSSEDSAEEVLRPRLQAAGADLDRVLRLRHKAPVLPDEIETLEHYIRE